MADTFNVTLTGDQETPPNDSTANGTGMVTWDAAADTLTYDFTIKGLDFGQVTAMHFPGQFNALYCQLPGAVSVMKRTSS